MKRFLGYSAIVITFIIFLYAFVFFIYKGIKRYLSPPKNTLAETIISEQEAASRAKIFLKEAGLVTADQFNQSPTGTKNRGGWDFTVKEGNLPQLYLHVHGKSGTITDVFKYKESKSDNVSLNINEAIALAEKYIRLAGGNIAGSKRSVKKDPFMIRVHYRPILHGYEVMKFDSFALLHNGQLAELQTRNISPDDSLPKVKMTPEQVEEAAVQLLKRFTDKPVNMKEPKLYVEPIFRYFKDTDPQGYRFVWVVKCDIDMGSFGREAVFIQDETGRTSLSRVEQ